MQPLAYFAVRSLLGWLQFVERGDRAFVSNALLLVATGAAHCWAVVYALFIAIHTRAMRYDGYHEGYTEHLPFWVSWTETLAVGSMGIWWAAGFTTAAIRIVDDDSRGLPSDARDVNVGAFFQIVRSPKLQDGLAIAHTVSCCGLFASIMLLCMAMALMKGAVTACELCLCFVSIGFALPHAVVAARKLNLQNPKKCEDFSMEPSPAAEAAAQEAASLGPQLCVLLALADSPGHAYLWQNFAYLISAVSFVAAVAACGRSPPKVGDAALPPDVGEFITCIALDVAASVALVICFPHLNTWHLWALALLLAALFAAVWFEGWRDLLVDLLDPLLVVRSDTDKALPGKQRQTLRRGSWVTTMICAMVALWDIMLHPVQDGLFETSAEHDGMDEGGIPNLWDENTLLLLRWRPPPSEMPGEAQLLATASEALGYEAEKMKTQAIFPNHRLLLFKFVGPDPEASTRGPVHMRWKAEMSAPKGKLAKIADTDFPASLNVTLCLHAHASKLLAKDKEVVHEEGAESAELAKVVGPAADAQAAYMAGCDWLTETLDSYYGEHDDHEHFTDAGDHATGLGEHADHENQDEEGSDIAAG
mmetsp:Transcript_99936/g.214014  ORF Transcript_99936/g.214014 Transcript_99936/m.214014 type:complete len:590 (+) Transcript_99936:147-1916(+)